MHWANFLQLIATVPRHIVEDILQASFFLYASAPR